jgi:hypothetical protein
MVLVDYIGIFFTCGDTFGHMLYQVFVLFALKKILLARKPNLETFSMYSNKFFHNFHLSESSFTCSGLRASGLARRLVRGFFICT